MTLSTDTLAGTPLTIVAPPDPSIRHHFTVDVEEYFHVSAMEPYVSVHQWDDMESRVRASVERLLALLAEHRSRGTFFVLGWLAERAPDLVRDIAAGGHEVASHGWRHQRVTGLTPDAFRADVRRSKALLEELTGVPVLGYRAPSFSIVPGREWALEILVEEGYRYDSSLFPVQRPGYGFPSAPRDPHVRRTQAGPLLEVPPTTLRRAGLNLPAAGGAYFRLFPLRLVQTAFREAAARGVPGTFYIHPWEIDPEQPRFAVPLHTRIRHYGGLTRAYDRLRRILGEFRFHAIADTLRVDGVSVLAAPQVKG